MINKKKYLSESLFRRLIKGIIANGNSQLINICIQLASLPIFLNIWNIETYGIWLLISSIASFFLMADIGVSVVASNRMAIYIGADNNEKAAQVFQGVQVFLLCISIIILVSVVLFLYFIDYGLLNSKDSRVALGILIIGVLVSFLGSINDGVFKATKRNSQGVNLATFITLMEWIAAVICLLIFTTYIAVALGQVLTRIILTLYASKVAVKNHSYFVWGINFKSIISIRQQLRDSILYMTYPAGNFLSFQGITFMVGITLGPSSIVIFNAYRTIARTVVQFNSILSHTLWSEFSLLYGANDGDKLKLFYHKSSLIGIFLGIFLSVIIYLISPHILIIWSNGKIEFESDLMVLFLIYAAISSFWHIPRVLLVATNKFTLLGLSYLFIALSTIITLHIYSNVYDIKMVIIFIIAYETIMAISAYSIVMKYNKNIFKNYNE